MLIEVIDAFMLMYKIFTSIVVIIFLYKRKDLRDIYMITIFLFNIFEAFMSIFFRNAKKFATNLLTPLKKMLLEKN